MCLCVHVCELFAYVHKVEMTGYVVDEDSPHTLKHSQRFEVPPGRERERERESVFALIVCVFACAHVCTCVHVCELFACVHVIEMWWMKIPPTLPDTVSYLRYLQGERDRECLLAA